MGNFFKGLITAGRIGMAVGSSVTGAAHAASNHSAIDCTSAYAKSSFNSSLQTTSNNISNASSGRNGWGSYSNSSGSSGSGGDGGNGGYGGYGGY